MRHLLPIFLAGNSLRRIMLFIVPGIDAQDLSGFLERQQTERLRLVSHRARKSQQHQFDCLGDDTRPFSWRALLIRRHAIFG